MPGSYGLGSLGIHVSQQVGELDGLLVGADVTDFTALPRSADEPAVSVSQEVERFGPGRRRSLMCCHF